MPIYRTTKEICEEFGLTPRYVNELLHMPDLPKGCLLRTGHKFHVHRELFKEYLLNK